MNITFIGGGNMASALIGGLLERGWSAAELRVVDVLAEARARLAQRFGVETAETPDVAGSDVVLLAVKPQQLHETARELAPRLERQLVVSIAAGIRAGDLSRWLGGYPRVVRAMPNTPALVQCGITGLYALTGVDEVQRQQAQRILGAVGDTLWLEREEQMDAVTAVSGSGPAYVFYFIEALQQAALELGFDRDQSARLALQTFQGAVTLARGSAEDAAILRARVTSKGGTTERALDTLEAAQVKTRIVEAVKAAARRSRELGDEFGKAD